MALPKARSSITKTEQLLNRARTSSKATTIEKQKHSARICSTLLLRPLTHFPKSLPTNKSTQQSLPPSTISQAKSVRTTTQPRFLKQNQNIRTAKRVTTTIRKPRLVYRTLVSRTTCTITLYSLRTSRSALNSSKTSTATTNLDKLRTSKASATQTSAAR